jgi:hypothetical protein
MILINLGSPHQRCGLPRLAPDGNPQFKLVHIHRQTCRDLYRSGAGGECAQAVKWVPSSRCVRAKQRNDWALTHQPVPRSARAVSFRMLILRSALQQGLPQASMVCLQYRLRYVEDDGHLEHDGIRVIT